MKVLGVIPARGGSKRIPRKNIKLLAGKPLIAYTIEAALGSTLIDRLIISTDDEEIAGVARTWGAEVPFLRPAELARDETPDQPVFRHALDWLKSHERYEPDILLNLRPTTPFKTPEIIDRVICEMKETNCDIVRTMTAVEGVNHPYWMYKLSQDGGAVPFLTHIEMSHYYQRQLLPTVYRINGVVDAMKAHVIYNGNILDDEDMKGLVISEEESIDIDTDIDFLMCECILNAHRSAKPVPPRN